MCKSDVGTEGQGTKWHKKMVTTEARRLIRICKKKIR